jgi:hypothetical protein
METGAEVVGVGVGVDAGGAVTATLADALAVPPAPLHVMV